MLDTVNCGGASIVLEVLSDAPEGCGSIGIPAEPEWLSNHAVDGDGREKRRYELIEAFRRLAMAEGISPESNVGLDQGSLGLKGEGARDGFSQARQSKGGWIEAKSVVPAQRSVWKDSLG